MIIKTNINVITGDYKDSNVITVFTKCLQFADDYEDINVIIALIKLWKVSYNDTVIMCIICMLFCGCNYFLNNI